MIGLYTSGYVGGWQNSRSRSYYGSNGNKYQGSSPSSYGSTFTAGDIIGVAFDGDNDTITFYKNGTSQGTAFSGNTADSSFGIQLSTGYYAETASLLLSSSDWNYSAPTGFGEWTGAITALNVGNYTTSGSSFNTVTNTYNGTASNITYQEATKFSPDLVWTKARTGVANAHLIQDSVRGANKALLPYSTSTEITSTDFFTSFDSNGFTLPPNAGTQTNASGIDYVAWCFNAGSGSATQNTNGSITSTVKANTDAGFSIVTYTGNNGSSATIGHGLNSAPELIITKARNFAKDGLQW